jgi:hypothetical protein
VPQFFFWETGLIVVFMELSENSRGFERKADAM